MRAEIQSTVEKIEKSLALLEQRSDWETAQHRLEEFNAMVEDPNLWDDPEKAQKLMRDRQMLVDKMGTYKAIESGLNDNVELIELGEMEDDKEIIAEAEAALVKLRDVAAQTEIEALLDGEILYRERAYDAAFARLREAVALDEELNYDEPWGWMQPSRHALGALLLEQGLAEEAEAVYRADLGLDHLIARDEAHGIDGRIGRHREDVTRVDRLVVLFHLAGQSPGSTCGVRG